MKDEEVQFLRHITTFVAEHPSVAAHVAVYAQTGLMQALDQAYARAADMEVALVLALSPKMKSQHVVIKDKLNKWAGKLSCRWDWFIEQQP